MVGTQLREIKKGGTECCASGTKLVKTFGLCNFLTLHFLEELPYFSGKHSVLLGYRLTSQKADNNIANLLIIYLTRCLEVDDAFLKSLTLPLIFCYNYSFIAFLT